MRTYEPVVVDKKGKHLIYAAQNLKDTIETVETFKQRGLKSYVLTSNAYGYEALPIKTH